MDSGFKFDHTMDIIKTVCAQSIHSVSADIAFPVFMQGVSSDSSL